MALASGRCGYLASAIRALDAVAPLALAAKWDNVGLVIDATTPFAPAPGTPYHVFLTNDLTPAVLDEAIAARSRLIVSYHPPVFGALKKFLLGSGHASTVVLRCAQHGIAVYSPHTAVDSVRGGLNDWLLGGILRALRVAPLPELRPIKPTEAAEFVPSGAGDGRMAALPSESSPSNVRDVIQAVKNALGLPTVQVALPSSLLHASRAGREAVLDAAAALPVRSIAVVAGSGASVLTGAAASLSCDVWVTGEMSHHEVLAANASGVAVILTNHSNCERGFLPLLAERLQEAWVAQGCAGEELTVTVSTLDADPLVAC